eukprot:21342-Heterococcus_DN1.PRE.1
MVTFEPPVLYRQPAVKLDLLNVNAQLCKEAVLLSTSIAAPHVPGCTARHLKMYMNKHASAVMGLQALFALTAWHTCSNLSQQRFDSGRRERLLLAESRALPRRAVAQATASNVLKLAAR